MGNLNLAEVVTYAHLGMKAKTLASSSSCNIPMRDCWSERHVKHNNKDMMATVILILKFD